MQYAECLVSRQECAEEELDANNARICKTYSAKITTRASTCFDSNIVNVMPVDGT
jgi:hypothetical protein